MDIEVAGVCETEIPLNCARYTHTLVLMFMYELLHLCLSLCKCQTPENNCLDRASALSTHVAKHVYSFQFSNLI